MNITAMRKQTHPAFTIVEIAIVIVVIGILATLTVVVTTGWRERVARTEVQSDLRNVVSAMSNARNYEKYYPSELPDTFRASENVQVDFFYEPNGWSGAYCAEAHSTAVDGITYAVYGPSFGKALEPVDGTCEDIVPMQEETT